jgi:hypothetical protein
MGLASFKLGMVLLLQRGSNIQKGVPAVEVISTTLGQA